MVIILLISIKINSYLKEGIILHLLGNTLTLMKK